MSITNVTTGFVLHGCNAQGKMNSGVAKAIRNKWPLAYEMYVLSPHSLGAIVPVEVGKDLYVINMITQERYGYDGKMYVSYDAVRSASKLALEFMDKVDPRAALPVCYPKIGSGLGGGDWEVVSNILNLIFKDRTNVLYVL